MFGFVTAGVGAGGGVGGNGVGGGVGGDGVGGGVGCGAGVGVGGRAPDTTSFLLLSRDATRPVRSLHSGGFFSL